MFPGQSINYINKRCLYLDFFQSAIVYFFLYQRRSRKLLEAVAKFYYFVDYF